MTESDESRSNPPPSRDPPDAALPLPTPEVPVFPFTPGQTWRDYRLADTPVPEGATQFTATDIHTRHVVVIRVFAIDGSTPKRRQTWGKVGELHLPDNTTVELVEAIEEGGRRFEVVRTSPYPTLRTWLVDHTADLGIVETALRQIVPLIEALHANGLVHLGLRPHTLFVDQTEEKIQFLLGGLEGLTLLPSADPTLIDRDPYYAPPESLSGSTPPADSLYAWDWWALGRVIQESVLGQPLLGHLLKRKVTPITPELHEKATSLLAEKDPVGQRSGAVESMPAIDPVLKSLLRGLLTHSPEGRWRSVEIRRWLDGETVNDRYDLDAAVRLFPWRGRTFTLQEVAEYFSQEDNWDAGESNLFAPPEDSSALINFLKATPAYHADAERVGGVLALVDQPAWQDLPLPARRTAVASAAWVNLAGQHNNLSLRIRGRGADWIGLQNLFQANPTGQAAPFFHALTTKAFIELVESLDASSARSLKLLASSVNEAFIHGIRLGLITEQAMTEHAQIFALGLESSLDLEGHLKRLRAIFSSHRNPEMAAYFTAPKPERWMLVLLAYSGERAVETGFITHSELNLERFHRLSDRAQMLATLVFWERLQKSLRSGPLLFSPWWVFIALWVGITVVTAFLTPAWIPTVLAVLAVLALRLLFVLYVRKRVRLHGMTPAPWTWKDHASRCRNELARIHKINSTTTSTDAPLELAEISAKIAAIPVQPRPKPPPVSPNFHLLWAGSVLSVLVALAAGAQIAYPVIKKAFSRTETAATPNAPVAPVVAEKPHFFDPPPGAPPGLYEEFNDGFGRTLRGPLLAWDVPATAIGPSLTVDQKMPASPEQIAYALISGETLLKPYPRKGISGLLAVRVPAGDGVGLMLYDGHARMLSSKDVFMVSPVPQSRAWHRLAGRNVVYLGLPEALAKDFETVRR